MLVVICVLSASPERVTVMSGKGVAAKRTAPAITAVGAAGALTVMFTEAEASDPSESVAVNVIV